MLASPSADLQKSIDYYHQAIKLDPNYAPAYAHVARAYFFLAFFGAVSPSESWGKVKEARAWQYRKASVCQPTLKTDARRLRPVCAGAKYKVEVCSHGERAEVPVARDQRNALVDTALGDQGIAETGFVARCEHLCPQAEANLKLF